MHAHTCTHAHPHTCMQAHMHTLEQYSALKKDETVLFAVMWMHLEMIRQGKTNIMRCHLHVESEI